MNKADSIRFVKGVGLARIDKLAKLGIHTIGDALYYKPRSWDFVPNVTKISSLKMAEGKQLVKGWVGAITGGRNRNSSLLHSFGGGRHSVRLIFFGWRPPMIRTHKELFAYGVVTSYNGKKQMVNPQLFELNDNLNEVGGPVYPASAGMPSDTIKGIIRKCLDAVTVPNVLPETATGLSEMDALQRLHRPADTLGVRSALAHFKTKELLVMQLAIAKRRQLWQQTISAKKCSKCFGCLLTRFKFSLTVSQKKAMRYIACDMEKTTPMNRLVTGDVGSGKTAVAFYAMMNAAEAGGQAVLILPTTVLAHQQYRQLCMLVGQSQVAILAGGVKILPGVRRKIYRGQIRYIVGTSAVQFANLEYKDLRLVVFDEQHKFGVNQRKIDGFTPHILTMTATPIPRTIMVGALGDMDHSHLEPWAETERTTAITDDLSLILNDMVETAGHGEQAYLVCSNLNDLEAWYDHLEACDNGLKIGMAHGQMDGGECNTVLSDFSNGCYDVLCCTTVIEVGIHVPDATLMVITDPDRFGLAQLHQLRGRVGRSGRKGSCLLYTCPEDITESAWKRLEQFCLLVDGEEVAMLDMKLRGPGAIFGDKQSGMPDLEYADLISDFKLLVKCKDTATQMIDKDPELDQPEHMLLGSLIKAKIKDETNFFAT